jgi:hypothetical protein
MVDVPADTPVTAPPEDTVATAGVLLVHTPPVVASARVVTAPGQTVAVPVIALTTGAGLTETL